MARQVLVPAAMRLTRTLLVPFLATSLLAGACGDDAPIDDPDAAEPEPDADDPPPPPPPPPAYDAVFTGAADDNVLRALVAGIGLDSTILGLYGVLYGNAGPGSDCPAVSTDEQGRTVLQGDCDLPEGGGHLGGRLIIENFDQLGAENQTADVILTAEDFSVPQDDFDAWTFDGTVRLATGGKTTIDLTSAYLGVEARIANRITCTESGDCTPDDGAQIDVDGIGTAAVEGEWNLSGEVATGTLVLVGEERLEATINDADCIPLTIDGVASELCPDGGGKRLAKPRL